MKNYDIAAYVWPAYTGDEPRTRIFWPEGYGEWQTVKAATAKFDGHLWPRKPLWGYVNEADPYVMEMQIEAATDHGVNVFIYDWYWYDNRPFLENCLNDGFLKAKNNHKMKFYLMWANHDANDLWDKRNAENGTVIWSGKVTEEQFDTIGTRWLDQYMLLDNYYKIDGKPLVSIYDLRNFIEGIGGVEKARKALEKLNKKACERGLAGIHFQYIKWGDDVVNYSGVDGGEKKVDADDIKNLGFESLTHYQFVHYMDLTKGFDSMKESMENEWKKIDASKNGMTYFPHVSVGWDNNPRYNTFLPHIAIENEPHNFEKLLQFAKNYTDMNNTVPLITINSWNEWTETSYLEPDDMFGYGYLEAVRNVFKQNS